MRNTNHQYMSRIFQFLQRNWESHKPSEIYRYKHAKTNVLICRMFMSPSMNVTIHLGPNYVTNWEIHENVNFEEIESPFSTSQKLIMEHSEEILNVKWLESSSPSWTRSLLSHDQAVKWAKSKVFVCADSLLCLRQINESQEVITRWEGQMEDSRFYPGFRYREFFEGSRKIWKEWTSNLKSSRSGSSSCQCSTS